MKLSNKTQEPPEIKEQRTYVEIGPNLKSVLERMIRKVEDSDSSTYLNVAFSPICQLITQLLKEKEKEIKPGEHYL